MSPVEFLLGLLLHEAPAIATKPGAEASWQKEIAAAVELDARVAQPGHLVSPEVDAALLDSMRWYEARMKSSPKDGDCRHEMIGKTGKWRQVCHAVGPLQVQASGLRAIVGTPEGDLAGVPPETKIDGLRDPEIGVRAGYAGLLRWKALCGGSPARWLTAYGWGKCPGKRAVDHEAVRRCELAKILLLERVQAPDFVCGHENRKIRDERDRRLLQWARERVYGETALVPTYRRVYDEDVPRGVREAAWNLYWEYKARIPGHDEIGVYSLPNNTEWGLIIEQSPDNKTFVAVLKRVP